MIARISICILAGTTFALAQNPPAGEKFDPVQEAIREFNKHRAEGRDVTVVLPPTTEKTAPATPADTAKPSSKDKKTSKPGKPEKASPAPPEKTATPEPPASPPELSARPAAPERKPGLSVQVQKIQTGGGTIDPSQVKLLAPFAAKPLVQPPDGWRIESSAQAPPFTREVELAPGAKITLTIRPHLLTPIADGVTIFSIPEPGYDAAASYQQKETVGAILSNSIQQLDGDSKQLGQAIDRLQQLLSSLPGTAPAQ